MQRSRLIIGCSLVCLLLFATAAAVTMGNDATASTPSPVSTNTTTPADEQHSTNQKADTADSTDGTDSRSSIAEMNRTYDGRIVGALAHAANGDTLIAGNTGLQATNATVERITPSGDTEWTYTYNSSNRTGIVAVEPAPNSGAYVLQTEQFRSTNATRPTVEANVIRLDGTGTATWTRAMNASTSRSVTMTSTDSGVVVVSQLADQQGVRLERLDAAGDTTLTHTYNISATPSTVRATHDGFLMTGVIDYDEPWVLRADDTGRVLFNETYSNTNVRRVAGAVPTADGGAIVGGWQRTGFGGATATPWAARLDSDGVTVWSRVYPTGAGTQIQAVAPTDDGLIMVGRDSDQWQNDGVTRVIGVGSDGTERARARNADGGLPTAVMVDGNVVTTASVTFAKRNYTSTVRTTGVPEWTAGTALDADATVTSNESAYRGQNLLFERSNEIDSTVDLVAIPDEYDDFDRHVVRRVHFDGDGQAVVESATLSSGEYALQTTSGTPLAVEDGTVTTAASNETTSFQVRSQDLYRVETDRTFVDATDGSGSVNVTASGDRSNYSVYVSADRFRGSSVSAETLRSAFADATGFAGVETVHGHPAARIDLGPEQADENDRFGASRRKQFRAAVGEFDPGFYKLRISGVDTADGGAVATTRVVVAKNTDAPLNVTLENSTLDVPVGNETSTNVTVSGLSHGIGAMSMSANRTGDPAATLHLSLDINSTRSMSSSGWSGRTSTAKASAINGDTRNGSVRVGELTVRTRGGEIDPNASATNTVTFRLDWVVDENGVPYALPGNRTVTVHVTDLQKATGRSHTHRSGSTSRSGTVTG